MNSIKLYGTGSGTANAVAQVVMPSKSRIRGIQAAVMADVEGDGDYAIVEVSRASASEIAVNGSQQTIVEVRLFNSLVTSGMAVAGVNTFFPLDVPVIQGQIIYLNANVNSATYYASFIIWWE